MRVVTVLQDNPFYSGTTNHISWHSQVKQKQLLSRINGKAIIMRAVGTITRNGLTMIVTRLLVAAILVVAGQATVTAQDIGSSTNGRTGQVLVPASHSVGYALSDSTLTIQDTQKPPAESVQVETGACSADYFCSCGDCQRNRCKRAELTGDWGGRRTCWAERGIVIKSSLTQFYQGVVSGGDEQKFRYGGKLDLFTEFNTEKMGFWKGGNFLVHAVSYNYGQNSNADATFLAPVNANMTYPKAEPSFAVSSLWFEQELGDQGYAALVGRYDLLDVWALFYPEYGRGIDGFMNVSSFVPFNIVLTGLPPVSNLAGIVKSGDEGVEAAFLVLENANHPTNIGLNFPNGVTILPTVRKYTKFGGLKGTHTLAAWYATGDFSSFDTNSWVGFPPGLGGNSNT